MSKNKEYWEKEHKEDGYKNVYSLTECNKIRFRIVNAIGSYLYGDIEKLKILVLGCGSRTMVQKTLAEWCNSVVICTDFQKVVETAKKNYTSKQIQYVSMDSAFASFKSNCIDVIVVINSILSDNHEENINILKSCFRVLRSDGILVGYFPTIYCALDIKNNTNHEKSGDWIFDLKNNTCYDPEQDISQIFYSPLKLRNILKDIGFNLISMNIDFFDSPHLINEAKKHYNFNGEDEVVYELFVKCKK